MSQPRHPNGRFMPVPGSVRDRRRQRKEAKAQAQAAPAPSTGRKLVYAAIVLDNSGSMSHISEAAKKAFNDLIYSFKANSTAVDTMLTTVIFGSHARVTQGPAMAHLIAPITMYYPNENTALFDGVGLAIETLQSIPRRADDEVSYLVMVVTDGEENYSMKWNARSINTKMAELQQGPWTFAYQVPRGYASNFTRVFGVPAGNIREWEQTTVGTQEMAKSNTRSLGTYYAAAGASASAVQVDSFFVQTDLSKLTSKQVQTKLDDLSDRFKAYEVKAEAPVKDFVEAKTKRPYVVGQAFYQLMKTEKVQPSKQVLIVEKGKQAVWGGQQARNLIGLPAGANAKVVPGNHSNYDIYVQSASVNRKLPRGTKVLIDVQQTQGIAPTWDHTQVKDTTP